MREGLPHDDSDKARQRAQNSLPEFASKRDLQKHTHPSTDVLARRLSPSLGV